MSLAQQTFDWIQDQLASGRTVNLTTHLISIQVTPRIAAEWKAAGRDLFKIAKNGCLYVSRNAKRSDLIAYPDTVLVRVTSQATIGSK